MRTRSWQLSVALVILSSLGGLIYATDAGINSRLAAAFKNSKKFRGCSWTDEMEAELVRKNAIKRRILKEELGLFGWWIK